MTPDFEKITKESDSYPAILGEISSPPPQIYVRGNIYEKQAPSVAIVGTRKATKHGLALAHDTAYELARAGVTIVSGLAMGVDTAAHRGALKARGKTIAVLGNGIDSIYPAQNTNLAKEILKSGGAIISEYGPETPSYKGNFIQRNRIIAGLSIGTVVVEAPIRSGTLTTARFAGEYGRWVFVFPGQVSNVNFIGSHALIRDGATLITNTSDILEDLGIDSTEDRVQINLDEFGEDERTVIETLRDEGCPLSVDRIIELTKLEPQVINRALATLVIYRILSEVEKGYELSNR